MVCETLSSIEELGSLEAEWDELVRAMPKPTPFLLHGWILAWLRHYAQDAEPAIHIARRNGQLVAALPLVVRRRFGLRIASFVGDDHPFVDMLLAAGESLETARALADYAAQSHDCASLLMISAESVIVKACGEHLRLVPRVCAPAFDLTPDFEHEHRERYSRKRRKIQRKLARLGTFEFEFAKTPDELAPALEHAFRLHALRWQGRFDTSGFVTPKGIDFHRDVSQNLARDGVSRVLTPCLDGQPIAFIYYFVLSGRMFCYRAAFDPEYARFSPGLLSLLAAIEQSAAEGVTTVELLGGTQPYKLEIADRIEQLYGGIGLSSGFRGRSYARVLALGYAFRNRLACSPLARRLYLERVGPLSNRLHAPRRGRRG